MPEHATAFAPGRVNLIGEHTDYNQGLALPFAISEGVTVSATAQPQRTIEAVACDLGERDRFQLDAPEGASGWRAFVRGAVGELQRAGRSLPGARVRIRGAVPRGAGLSSSAALEVALTLALIELARGRHVEPSGRAPGPDPPDLDRIELARLCSRIEKDWVGAQTGLLDQLACLFGQRDKALRIDFRSLEGRPVPLELGGYKLVTLDSGERHANAASGYNRRRAECLQACERLDVASLRDATLDVVARLPVSLSSRARHVITENARVEEAVAALERGDLPDLGRLLDASHRSLRDDYEVSTPAVEATAERLRRAGAVGARIVGGGFGGHVLALLAPDAAVPNGALEVRPAAGARLLE